MAITVSRRLSTRVFVSYNEVNGKLRRREVTQVKDVNDVWSTVEDTLTIIDDKIAWRNSLEKDKDELVKERNRIVFGLNKEIDFLTDQITEIDNL